MKGKDSEQEEEGVGVTMMDAHSLLVQENNNECRPQANTYKTADKHDSRFTCCVACGLSSEVQCEYLGR